MGIRKNLTTFPLLRNTVTATAAVIRDFLLMDDESVKLPPIHHTSLSPLLQLHFELRGSVRFSNILRVQDVQEEPAHQQAAHADGRL